MWLLRAVIIFQKATESSPYNDYSWKQEHLSNKWLEPAFPPVKMHPNCYVSKTLHTSMNRKGCKIYFYCILRCQTSYKNDKHNKDNRWQICIPYARHQKPLSIWSLGFWVLKKNQEIMAALKHKPHISQYAYFSLGKKESRNNGRSAV